MSLLVEAGVRARWACSTGHSTGGPWSLKVEVCWKSLHRLICGKAHSPTEREGAAPVTS